MIYTNSHKNLQNKSIRKVSKSNKMHKKESGYYLVIKNKNNS